MILSILILKSFLNSEHYKWALDALFIKHNFGRVIILEGLILDDPLTVLFLDISACHLIPMVNWLTDDMEIAPDFFEYFEAAAKLLDNDKYVTLYSVYTWQVNKLISNMSNYVAVKIFVVVLKDDNGCFFLE
jgi:hypothetical protein